MIMFTISYNWLVILWPYSPLEQQRNRQELASVVCAIQCKHSNGVTPGRARANALAEIPPPWLPSCQSKGVIKKIIYQDISTALADVTNDLSMPCH